MELNEGKKIVEISPGPGRLIDLMGAVLREGAEAVGIPCRASFLFSNRGVSTMDVAKDLSCSVVHEVAGDSGASGFPFVVSVLGPFGVWTKTTLEESKRLQ